MHRLGKITWTLSDTSESSSKRIRNTVSFDELRLLLLLHSNSLSEGRLIVRFFPSVNSVCIPESILQKQELKDCFFLTGSFMRSYQNSVCSVRNWKSIVSKRKRHHPKTTRNVIRCCWVSAERKWKSVSTEDHTSVNKLSSYMISMVYRLLGCHSSLN